MGLRTIFKAAGHWLKGSIFKVDSEIQFDATTNPEIDSTGGDFIWKTKTSVTNSWKLIDVTISEDILQVDTLAKTITLHPNYTSVNFNHLTTLTTSISYTAVNNDVVLATAGAGGITISLPDATGNDNWKITVMMVDAGPGQVTINTIAGNINGSPSSVLLNPQNVSTLISNGGEWWIISEIV